MTITIEKELTSDHIKVLNVLRNTKKEIITKQSILDR
ncbi:pathogenicity island protein, partial [Staphylococcus epidermidis]